MWPFAYSAFKASFLQLLLFVLRLPFLTLIHAAFYHLWKKSKMVSYSQWKLQGIKFPYSEQENIALNVFGNPNLRENRRFVFCNISFCPWPASRTACASCYPYWWGATLSFSFVLWLVFIPWDNRARTCWIWTNCKMLLACTKGSWESGTIRT